MPWPSLYSSVVFVRSISIFQFTGKEGGNAGESFDFGFGRRFFLLTLSPVRMSGGEVKVIEYGNVMDDGSKETQVAQAVVKDH